MKDKASIETVAKISAYVMKGLFSNPSVDEVKLNWINQTPDPGATKSELNIQMDKQVANTKDWDQYKKDLSNTTYKSMDLMTTLSKIGRFTPKN